MDDGLLIEKLKVANGLTARLGTNLNLKSLVRELAQAAREIANCERAVVLLVDSANRTLSIASIAAAEVPQFKRTPTPYNPNEPAVWAWMHGEPFLTQAGEIAADSSLEPLLQVLEMDGFYSLPLRNTDALSGVILLDNPFTRAPLNEESRELIDAIQASAEIVFTNASLYSQTLAERDAQMQELEMMRQIDRELSDTMQLEQVFDLTLDWALRYTLAQGGTLALYSAETDEFRLAAALGYNADDSTTAALRAYSGGIALRVARSGYAELIPDVSVEPSYYPISSTVRSHMSVPVVREDQVIAVITVENRRLNAFTEDHVQFVAKLAARAGVAIDNARLYSESVREREKLSHILSEIADIVIVIGIDDRVLLLNQSGIAALRRYSDSEANYIGLHFADALVNTPLLPAIEQAKASGQMMVQEVELDNERTYYAEFSPQEDIGWIIVMHDITPLKETEELKNELVATVSHDLKQPLSVMNGYLQLLQMTHSLDERGDNFARMIARSIDHMRHLIDDVLDLAKIESGIALNVQPVVVDTMLKECIEGVKPLADSKLMQLDVDLNTGLPMIAGDPNRLQQIFNNLVGNAVKYTQREGRVRVSVERLDRNLRFMVKDNGMGISPEDQARIFDRFYRVRRPETETIEGTGLGLAIVKKLIEAHQGQIGLESSLGEGTTFYVTLPIYTG